MTIEEKIIADLSRRRTASAIAIAKYAPVYVSSCSDEIREWLRQKLQETPEYESLENVVKCVFFGVELPRCKTCGKTIKYSRRHFTHCSNRCAQLDEDVVACKEKTSMENYGVGCYLKTDECRAALAAAIESSHDEVVAKRIATFETNYGSYRERTAKTKATVTQRYGVDSYSKTDEYKEKSAATNVAKYGKPSKKTAESWSHILSLDYAEPMFSFDEYEAGGKKTYKWRCKVCGYEYLSRYDDGNVVFRCPRCKLKTSFVSKMERELADFCRLFFPNLHESDRRLIKRCELDIVIPEMKLAIEFNGSYWHSRDYWASRHPGCTLDDYLGLHIGKTLKCNERGYRLIHVWEDEWLEDKDSVKWRLAKIFNGEEDLMFYDDEITLDRAWFNNLKIPGYTLDHVIKPGIVKRGKYDVADCGWMVLTRDA